MNKAVRSSAEQCFHSNASSPYSGQIQSHLKCPTSHVFLHTDNMISYVDIKTKCILYQDMIGTIKENKAAEEVLAFVQRCAMLFLKHYY